MINQQNPSNRGLGALTQTDSASRFGSAPSGYGDMYDQLFAANPYRQQTYNQSGWQKFLQSLGFRTGYDDWLDQTSTQIAEYDAGIFSIMQQNEYNSEAAKAQRMRAAGLNSDLLGIGDASESAVPAEDVNGMTPQDSEGQAKQLAGLVGGFINWCQSAFSIGLQTYESMARVKQIGEQVNALATENADRIVDVVDKIIVGSIPISAYESGDKIDEYLKTIDFGAYGFSGKGLTAAQEAFRDRFDSFKNHADIREAAYRRFNALSNTYKVGSEGFIPESQMPESPDEMFNLQIEHYANIARKILDLKLGNERVKEEILTPQEQANQSIANEIERDTLQTEQDMDFGAAVGAANTFEAQNKGFWKQAESIINEEKAIMYMQLQAKARAGSSFATAMLHAMALQDMMKVDFGADVNISFLKGLAGIAGKMFSSSEGRGKDGNLTWDTTKENSVTDEFKKTFGSGFGLSFRFGNR